MNGNDYDYMRALWSHFYGAVPKDHDADEQHHCLSQQLEKNLRSQLLKLVDCQNIHTEEVSLESFIAGFKLAAGIAGELAGEWYSYEKEENIRWEYSQRNIKNVSKK